MEIVYKKEIAKLTCVQHTGSNYDEIIKFCDFVSINKINTNEIRCFVGDLPVRIGDWIVKNQGQYYTYSDEAFNRNFDFVKSVIP